MLWFFRFTKGMYLFLSFYHLIAIQKETEGSKFWKQDYFTFINKSLRRTDFYKTILTVLTNERDIYIYI